MFAQVGSVHHHQHHHHCSGTGRTSHFTETFISLEIMGFSCGCNSVLFEDKRWSFGKFDRTLYVLKLNKMKV